jgi:DNA invertase Pin-like site-specific DNA recombinase
VNAAIYTRISNRDEADILKNQLSNAKTYCLTRRLHVARIYQEIASGTLKTQSALNELLHDAHRREFDVVVFTSLSRMTREGIAGALYTLDRLKRAGVGWAFVEQPMLNYDADTPPLVRDVLLSVLAAVDEDYRRRISASTKRAYQQRLNLANGAGERVRWGRPKGSRDKKPRVKRGPPRSALDQTAS